MGDSDTDTTDTLRPGGSLNLFLESSTLKCRPQLVTSRLKQVSLGEFKAQTQLCCVCVKINHCNRESNIMMGTQRAFLSPASSPANNGLHKYEQHINTGPGWSSGAQVSRDRVTPHSVKLSLCKSSRVWELQSGRGCYEGRSPDTRCDDWSKLRGCHHRGLASSVHMYTRPPGRHGGRKWEILCRDPL